MFRRWFMAAISLLTAAAGSQVCDLDFTSCPGNFSGDTLHVSQDIIALNAKIPVCLGNVQVHGTGETPPISVVFIIDDSRSMWGTDPTASRYTVVSGLLDRIHAASPSSEVGFAVFNSLLDFDSRDNPFFQDAFPNDASMKYNSIVPLTALNKVFANGKTGLDTLKAFLSVKEIPASGSLRQHFELVYKTQRRTSDGTKIDVGFNAALFAMQAAKTEKKNQFFIFLSDGISSLQPDFLTTLGTNTPTTFTVYFTGADSSQPAVVPQTIADITAKVKGSAYSTSNAKSAYFATNLPGSELDKILQTDIFGKILIVPTTPKTAAVDVNGSSSSSTNFDTSQFLFAKRMPLSAQDTRLHFSFTNTYIDSATGNAKDTVMDYVLTVRRDPATASLPGGVSKSCREQPSLALYGGGQILTSVAQAQTDLEARLQMPAGDSCSACKVTVQASQSPDKEVLSMTPVAGYYRGLFTQSLDSVFASGDGKLEHRASDSIVLVYVNSENPLDQVRKSYPFVPAPPPVPSKVATPFANPAGENFQSPLQVTLSTVTPGAVIYYTTDGTDPSPTGAGTSKRYGGPLTLDATSTLKAVAAEDKWIPSDIMTEKYVYTPPIAVAKAWYLDADGDGRIETIRIRFAGPLPALPEKMQFTLGGSEGWAQETRTLPEDGSAAFSGSDRSTVIITLSKPFPFGLTEVANPATSGKAFGQSDIPLAEGTFAVADSVAPVIRSADIQPQDTVDGMVRTLVAFSEPILMNSSLQPAFVFKRGTTEINPDQVKIHGFNSVNARQVEIIVDSLSEFFPNVGDSIAINDNGAIADPFGNTPARKIFQVLGGEVPNAKPSDIFVTFANGTNIPGPVPRGEENTSSDAVFIPVDKNANALPGRSSDGKCPACYVGREGGFIGPVMNLEIPGAVDYDFRIFDNLGEFVVAGRGKIEESDLTLLTPIKNGRQYLARIVWTGRTAKGTKAGTGAYVLASLVTTAKDFKTGAAPATETRKLLFGMLRQ